MSKTENSIENPPSIERQSSYSVTDLIEAAGDLLENPNKSSKFFKVSDQIESEAMASITDEIEQQSRV